MVVLPLETGWCFFYPLSMTGASVYPLNEAGIGLRLGLPADIAVKKCPIFSELSLFTKHAHVSPLQPNNKPRLMHMFDMSRVSQKTHRRIHFNFLSLVLWERVTYEVPSIFVVVFEEAVLGKHVDLPALKPHAPAFLPCFVISILITKIQNNSPPKKKNQS